MLHDNSFITGLLIGDKEGYTRGYQEGDEAGYDRGLEDGGGGSSARDTIEFGAGETVDIWKVPAYTEYPINGSSEDSGLNRSFWGLYRAQYCCAILEKMYGIYATATLPDYNIITGTGYTKHGVYLTDKTHWTTIVGAEYQCDSKGGLAVRTWDENMWLIVSPSIICCVTKASGQFSVPAVMWGFVWGQGKESGEWRPWYGSGLSGEVTFAFNGTAGDLSNPATTIEDDVSANQPNVMIEGGTGQVDNLWYIRNTKGIIRDDGSIKVVPNFKSVGTVTAHTSGRKLLYLCHDGSLAGGSYPAIYNYFFILLPKGVNKASWRGLLDKDILKDVSLLDGGQWLSHFNEDEISSENTPNSYYAGYNAGYEAGLAGGGGGEPDGSYDEGYQAGYQAGYSAGLAASGDDDGYTLHPAPDGATELHVSIEAAQLRAQQLCFCQTVAHGVQVDWGDGSPVETVTGTGDVHPDHNYSSNGDYVIRLIPADGCDLTLGGASKSLTVFGDTGAASGSSGRGVVLKKALIGDRVPTVGRSAFHGCCNLEEAYVSDGTTELGTYCFRQCGSLHRIRLPSSLTTLGDACFDHCYGLGEIDVPAGVETISTLTFTYCQGLKRISLPGVTSIANATMTYCWGLQRVDLPATLTTLDYRAFSGTINLREIHIAATTPPTLNGNLSVGYNNYVVYIPAGSLAAYSTANRWSAIAAKLIEE